MVQYIIRNLNDLLSVKADVSSVILEGDAHLLSILSTWKYKKYIQLVHLGRYIPYGHVIARVVPKGTIIRLSLDQIEWIMYGFAATKFPIREKFRYELYDLDSCETYVDITESVICMISPDEYVNSKKEGRYDYDFMLDEYERWNFDHSLFMAIADYDIEFKYN